MLKLQFLTGKKHNEEWSPVKNCNFSKLQFFKCTFTVISLHIFAVYSGIIEKNVIKCVHMYLQTLYFLVLHCTFVIDSMAAEGLKRLHALALQHKV